MAMRLGRETKSVTNWMMSGTNGSPAPVVGMGATILMWSDRHAATIVHVTKTQVHVRRDRATLVSGSCSTEDQVYRYEEDLTASVEVFRLTKRGYRKTGGGAALRIGERDEYSDPTF